MKVADRDKRPGVGIGVMILKDGKVLLGKRNDDPAKADSQLHGEGTWTMPGGKLHFGESFEDAAYREVLEETGIKINKEKLKFISLTNDRVEDAHFITIGFLCEDFEGEAGTMEPEEITEWRWFGLDNLPRIIFFPSEKILKNYSDKEIYKN
ncbi:MAG TPA: NUDIX domain-containing protein [archaeon]|nr:NUDIX domain-containing protein [archaeon]